MDQERIDQWARLLSGAASRRGAVALAGSAVFGWTVDSEAKKRKKRKKKGKGSPGATCATPLHRCNSNAGCCATEYSPEQPICRVMFQGSPKQCCVPHHAPIDFYNTMCCGRYDEDAPGGGRRCCIDMGLPDEGTPQFCCADYPSINGFCCVAAGWSCKNGTPCCNGGVCTNGECP